MSDTVVMELPDGRELAWLEMGDTGGPAVFVFHGTPGSRLQVSFDREPIDAAKVRFVAVDPCPGIRTQHLPPPAVDWRTGPRTCPAWPTT